MNDGAPGGEGDVTRPAATDSERRELIKWGWRLPVILAAGGAAYGIAEAVRVHFFKRRPSDDPCFDERPASRVGPLAAFAGDWDSAPFELAGSPSLPGIALRLPQPIAGGLSVTGAGETVNLAAFSRICTHQHCIVSLNPDVAAINIAFNYRAKHPAMTCPCHLSVFDPQRSGRAVSGPAVTPLPRVRLRLENGIVLADGIELT